MNPDNQQTVEEAAKELVIKLGWGPDICAEEHDMIKCFKAGVEWQQSQSTNTGEGVDLKKLQERFDKFFDETTVEEFEEWRKYKAQPPQQSATLEGENLSELQSNESFDEYVLRLKNSFKSKPPQQSANPEGEWISVFDALPENCTPVICYWDYRSPDMEEFTIEDLTDKNGERVDRSLLVNFWMPLPKPPMKSDEGDSLYNDKK